MRSIYSIPAFNGGVTSALGAYPGAKTRGVGGWSDVLNSLTPLAQAAAASELRNLGVPSALVQGGQAVAYKAQGYNFTGGTVSLRSGLSGTPMVSPSGQTLLLTADGSAVPYTSADVGAPASGGGGGAGQSSGMPSWLPLAVLGGVAFLLLSKN